MQQKNGVCRRAITRAYAHNKTHLCDGRRALYSYKELNYWELAAIVGG